MKEKKPTEQEILDAKIAPLHARWSPCKDDPAIGMPESILRALAGYDEGARRVVQLADAWNGPEVPGNKLDEFFCGLISGKTVKNHDSEKTGPEGKWLVGNKKSAYEKWPLAAWFYLRYFCKLEHRGKALIQIALEEEVIANMPK